MAMAKRTARKKTVEPMAEVGLTLFDVKRRRGTPGSQYDARSLKGIRTKTKRGRKRGSNYA